MGAETRPAAGHVARVAVGQLATNCYLVDDGRGGVAVVDPGADAARVLAAVGERPVSAVLVTHAHFDHVGAVDALAERCPSGWAVGAADWPLAGAYLAAGVSMFGVEARLETPPARLLSDGDVVEAGELRLRVVGCPGHSPGGVAYVEDAFGLAFTGDTLFAGSAGRVDLPGGDPDALRASLARLSALPPAVRVFPGHGPATTVGRELASNPYMRFGA